uniref:Uncharacterized protein n=1 Tax=Oryza brachyantha TaxID=4533 RepID=J3M473_ORYBR
MAWDGECGPHHVCGRTVSAASNHRNYSDGRVPGTRLTYFNAATATTTVPRRMSPYALQEHGITDGFIVDEVYTERLGIFKGDVIVSYNGRRDFILHMFEAYLLSLGWGFLESSDSSWTTDLELEIYDPVGCITRCVTFTLGFSDTSEKVLGLL